MTVLHLISLNNITLNNCYFSGTGLDTLILCQVIAKQYYFEFSYCQPLLICDSYFFHLYLTCFLLELVRLSEIKRIRNKVEDFGMTCMENNK